MLRLEVQVQKLLCLERARGCSGLLWLCQDASWETVCTQAPYLRDRRVGSVHAQGLFGLEKRKVGIQTWMNSGSRPPTHATEQMAICSLRRQS